MNKEINEALKKILDSLSDEQKEKAKACRTAEELLKLAQDAGIALPDELLEAAAGGIILPLGYEEVVPVIISGPT